MAKLLIEGYRPGKGDGGRWVGVMDTSSKRDASSGKVIDAVRQPKLPSGGSAIRDPKAAASAVNLVKK